MGSFLSNNMWTFNHSCEDHMWLWFRLNGRTKSGLNIVAKFQIIMQIFNTIFILYKLLFTVCEDVRFVLHFLTLAYFYSGILWTVYYKSAKFTEIARECDTFVGLTSDEDKRLHEAIKQRLKWTKLGYGLNVMTAQTFNIAFIIGVRPLVLHLIFGAPRELVFSGRDESWVKFWLLYIAQASFMATAMVTIPVNTQLLYRICFHIVIKYRLLNYRLSQLYLDTRLSREGAEAKLNRDVIACINHHQHLLKIFNDFKKVCSYSFTFSYFGLFACIALSRTALVGDNPDYKVVPDFFTESLYLFYQCYCLNDLTVESENVILAFYENEWVWFPRSTVKMLHIIGTRTRKQPLVQLFPGGSPATLQTYGVLMNASMAYFMSAFIL